MCVYVYVCACVCVCVCVCVCAGPPDAEPCVPSTRAWLPDVSLCTKKTPCRLDLVLHVPVVVHTSVKPRHSLSSLSRQLVFMLAPRRGRAILNISVYGLLLSFCRQNIRLTLSHCQILSNTVVRQCLTRSSRGAVRLHHRTGLAFYENNAC